MLWCFKLSVMAFFHVSSDAEPLGDYRDKKREPATILLLHLSFLMVFV